MAKRDSYQETKSLGPPIEERMAYFLSIEVSEMFGTVWVVGGRHFSMEPIIAGIYNAFNSKPISLQQKSVDHWSIQQIGPQIDFGSLQPFGLLVYRTKKTHTYPNNPWLLKMVDGRFDGCQGSWSRPDMSPSYSCAWSWGAAPVRDKRQTLVKEATASFQTLGWLYIT